MKWKRDEFDISLAPETQDIPEYHDCQRLLETREYGPLVGIWSREGDIRPQEFDQPGGTAVAQVYNFTPGPGYTPLPIPHGNHCVYLARAQDSSWTGRMLFTRADMKCPLALRGDSLRNSHELAVRRTTRGTQPTHYVNAARWDHDGTVHFMGVRCLDGWCEIGPATGFGESASYTGNVQRLVKGWYDEQRLALRVAGGGLVPATMKAAVFPEPTLGRHTIADFTCTPAIAGQSCGRNDGWIHVATVEVESSASLLTGYDKKLNLAAGETSIVYMRRDLKPEQGATEWQARIVRGRSVVYRNVARTPHLNPNFPPPSTARWHWRSDDETIWVRCELGCCDITEDGFGP